MTSEISDKFEEPTAKNVEVGDFLVYFDYSGVNSTPKLAMYHVLAVTDDLLIYRKEHSLNEISFNGSVILKRSTGKCLLGKYVWNTLPEL